MLKDRLFINPHRNYNFCLFNYITFTTIFCHKMSSEDPLSFRHKQFSENANGLELVKVDGFLK